MKAKLDNCAEGKSLFGKLSNLENETVNESGSDQIETITKHANEADDINTTIFRQVISCRE